jgi:hypothetical protein
MTHPGIETLNPGGSNPEFIFLLFKMIGKDLKKKPLYKKQQEPLLIKYLRLFLSGK